MSAHRHLLEASAHAGETDAAAALAVVVETEGSTYVRRGAMALFGEDLQVGWLSGGCLEPEIARRAQAAITSGRLGWMEIDTRDDEDLLSGSAPGCRGRLRIALMPLRALPGWSAPVRAWLRREGELQLRLQADGALALQAGKAAASWSLPCDAPPWQSEAMSVRVPAPLAITLFGAGPETQVLVPLLRQLGWMTQVVERRTRWLAAASVADHVLQATPRDAAEAIAGMGCNAALVMHHDFELDREALDVLAHNDVSYIGLLGPRRRRDDLFKLLTQGMRESLQPRLHSPVGMPLGGHGPEAIALSIAAQLQAWRAGVETS
ncbi:XshC-Cox1-family protein [Luteimonas aestuarii]|uniref:XshC-Cox1-family protein n=1 Tax=Luteimonas aestuarii TaxID=453837 RepID=A0A4R5TTS1_9GAMM|nr:XdhC/CoxI family protein [Luteimonas aestuarii]TDK24411.1 XshC-Cox1-family protein [Luteimonas aestuarii]